MEVLDMRITRKALYMLGLCGALVLGFAVNGAFNGVLVGSSNPGGPQDPLVTQSYVDQAIALALAEFGKDFACDSCEGRVGEPHGDNCVGMTFTPVRIFAGWMIMGGEGTEIILRSGEAAIFAPGPDGVVNTTIGADMPHNAGVTANHYLIIPRADGRAIRAITDAWFMVKGNFDITLAP